MLKIYRPIKFSSHKKVQVVSQQPNPVLRFEGQKDRIPVFCRRWWENCPTDMKLRWRSSDTVKMVECAGK